MSRKRNDPSSLYAYTPFDIGETQWIRSEHAERNSEAIANAALFLVPIGGVVRGARAARWAAHGASRFKYSRGKGFRWRSRKKGKYRSPPPSVGSDAYVVRKSYSRSRKAIERRLPLRRTRRSVDKWQGRVELVTNPTHYVTRRVAGRAVPGGMLTIGGVRYLISSLPSIGGGGPDEQPQPTASSRPGTVSRKLKYQFPDSGTPGSGSQKSASGNRVRSRPRSCPPGHYYSFKHRQCRPSKYRR